MLCIVNAVNVQHLCFINGSSDNENTFVITKTFENTVDIQFYSPLVSTFILTSFWVHALKGIRPPQMTPSFETWKSYFHIFSTRERKEHVENIQFKRTKA